MKVLVAGVFMLLSSRGLIAAELAVFREADALGVTVQGVRFPNNLQKDLVSGLTNRLLIRITLEQTNQRARQRSAEIAIRYDLWDENFTTVTRLDGNAVDTQTQRSAQDVTTFLNRIRLIRLFPTAGMDARSELSVRAELLLNPIDRERMENIRKWVLDNSARPQLDPAGALAASDASLANAVFNRIFEQYASGSDLAAAWQLDVSTPPFTLQALQP
jgi:hypothetical protein